MQPAPEEMTRFAETVGDPYADSGKLIVAFHLQAVEDEGASAAEGRPIFKEVEFVKIFTPGDKDNIVDRMAYPADRLRYPRQYAAFKAGREADIGTPLAAWPGINQAQRREMEYFNVRTVEQLANLTDANAMGHMGIQALKQKAQAFLDAAKAQAPVTVMQKELADRDQKIEMLEKVVREQGDRIEQLSKSRK